MAIEVDPNDLWDHRNTAGGVGGRQEGRPRRPQKPGPHRRDHAKRAQSHVGAVVVTKFRFFENPQGFEPYCSPAAKDLDGNDGLDHRKVP